MNSAPEIVESILAECEVLPVRNTPSLRGVRRKYTRLLRDAPGDRVVEIARQLRQTGRYRWFGYELILAHPGAFQLLDASLLEELGQGLDSWWTTDAFARTLSGPAWLRGQAPDGLILDWAGSPDRWWRRAALVSTVALNMRSQGGHGDPPRTLRVCRILAGDHDDMVAKALSWALRELVPHDPGAVQAFLDEHQAVLAALVQREVQNKLRTGLKNPTRKRLESG